MTYYITHILTEKLPEKGNYKQLSFLVANAESPKNQIFFYGYRGSVRLTEDQLTEEIKEGKIIRLASPKKIEKEKFLWLDSSGAIWASDDNHLKVNKECLEPSGIKEPTDTDRIYQTFVKPQLPKIKRRTIVKEKAGLSKLTYGMASTNKNRDIRERKRVS